MWEDYLYEKHYDRWYQEYIEDIDLANIKWIKLNASELIEFYDENYYDQESKSYALSTEKNSIIVSPFGLSITSIYSDQTNSDYTHVLGIVPNKKGKYTIVAKAKINEHYKYLDEVPECTYIDYIETNSFFRRRGLFKETVKALSKLIDSTKDIILTPETEMGSLCRTTDHLRQILIANNHCGKVKTESEIHDEIEKSFQKKMKKEQ